MATRIDPDLMKELKEYGAVGIEKCYNCGNCTAICPLTSTEHPFPRNMIRYVQTGMKDRILENTDPWLCYYCGECSDTCPKGAEPAETMMAVRRWMTAQYDRSGHGAKLYKSEKALWWTVVRIALLPLLALVIFHWFTGADRIVTDRVALNEFAPVMIVWAFVLFHGLFLGYRLLSGGYQMYKHVMEPINQKMDIPLSLYVKEFKTFITHFLTQKRWRDCGEDRSRWLNHLLLVSGYGIMLVLIVLFLWWFQTDNIYPLYHPQRWIGYYATIVLIYASVEALVGRYRKREQIHKFSHPTDWLFPTFILVGAITGILVHIFRYVVWPWPTYIMYTIHVMAMMAMLDTEVGIGKWTHLLYRPLAMYLDSVKERAQEEVPSGALAPAD